MNRRLPLIPPLAGLGLAACVRSTVVAEPMAPAGATGNAGDTGSGTTVLVIPPAASAPSN